MNLRIIKEINQYYIQERETNVEAFKKKLVDLIDRIIVSAIRVQILMTQDKDGKCFRKRHQILKNLIQLDLL
jgi:hypothetical protein